MTRSFKERRVVINGFDMSLRHLVVFVTGLLPGIVVLSILWAFVGEYALFALAAVEALWFWLIIGRSSTGTHEVNWRAIARKRASLDGRFLCCGVVVDPLHGDWGHLVPASISVRRHPLAVPDVPVVLHRVDRTVVDRDAVAQAGAAWEAS